MLAGYPARPGMRPKWKPVESGNLNAGWRLDNARETSTEDVSQGVNRRLRQSSPRKFGCSCSDYKDRREIFYDDPLAQHSAIATAN
jgi:hypothetical protein